MKLHLPVSLFKCLMSLLPAVAAVTCMPVSAEVMHQDISLITYTDFGQNTGRYVTDGSANSLLQYIRQQEGGVVITYTGGQADYTLAHGMIDFGSAYHVATAAAISPAAIATVAHHDINFTSTFTNKVYGIGNENAIKYKAIEYVKSSAFSHQETEGGGNLADHKVVRLSKIITDVSPASIYNAASDGLNNLTYYHVGSGRQWIAPYTNNLGTMNNSSEQLISGYNYVTGGITTTNWVYQDGGADHKVLISQVSFMPDGINSSNPLTWVSKPGDSGSPLYVWDESKQCYSYVGSNFGEVTSGTIGSVFVLDPTFDQQTVDSFTKVVNMGRDVSTVYLNAVNNKTGELSDGTRTGEVWSGTVTDGTNTLVTYNGLKSELNTWGNLNDLKDTQNWYTYNESYVIQNTETLFSTENLQFNAQSAQNTIILNDSVDLGIGYAEFNAGTYTITSADGRENLFNHAGYVVNVGAEVHVQLTNPAEYMREWRKIGAGNLYIEGSGNNHILLNVGDSGKTYLNREGGYAAYNVLVNNGATVVIRDANQIKRDLTFGNRGGTLNLNGNSMDWYTTAETADSNRTGFSINALTEDAVIANTTAGTGSVLTYKEGGATTFLGSFVDSANSSLQIVYDANGTWVLNSVRTNLQHVDSGLQVNQGTVALRGTNTVHGTGSDTGRNENRYLNENDWHYADATMNVAVQNGGTFELGSHARLTGDVAVAQGGTYVMREAVRHREEYVEGGQKLEDTGKYSAYFGHKGNVQLNGGTFAVQFNDGVDANTDYAGNVSGTGAMTVDTGMLGASFTFSGAVASGISKTLNRGQLILAGTAAADTSNKWLVNAGGVMVQFANAQDTLAVIDSSSSGILGLTQDCDTQLNLKAHAGLGVGALCGSTVQYGAAGTSERLSTLNFGGGGKMVVNYALSGADTVNLNAGAMRGGEIQLANVAQNYTGTVNVQAEGGTIALTTAADGALNGATVNLNNGGTWKLADNQHSVGGTVNVNSGGTLQGKDVVLTGTANLAGRLDYNSLTVQDGGRLVMQNGGALGATNAVTIANGGTLDLNATSFTQKATLTNGGSFIGQGATIAEGAEIIAAGGVGILSSGSGTLTVNGLIGAAEGATLRLAGSRVDIYAANINTGGGVLELASNTYLGYRTAYATQNIGGTLSVVTNSTLHTEQGDPYRYQNITHNINHLHISDGKKLTITDSSSDWNHIYNISSLTGRGEIEWQGTARWFDNTPSGPSRLVLSGDNSFEGTLLVNQKDNHGSMQHVSLSHDNAAKNMVINMWGDSDSRPALAVNTQNAHVAGIGGTTYTFVYAGEIKSYGNGSNPVSSALNTLTINTAGVNHTYNGTILGDATNGLNIVKEGAGSQTFTNSANVVHDVTALQGRLEFTNALTVYGDVSIAQGAELTLGSGAYSLDAGHVLNVLAGNDGAQAVLNNGFVYNGGTLGFSAYDVEQPVLTTQGFSVGVDAGVVNLVFSNLKSVDRGTSYLLAEGDWSDCDEFNITLTDCRYYQANLNANDTGLSVTFDLSDNSVYWEGSSTRFDSDSIVLFTEKDGIHAAELPAGASVNTGVFDNDADYTLSSADGAALSFGSVEKYGDGSLVLNAAVDTDTLQVMDACTITGSGSMRIGNLELHANLTTGMALEVTSVNDAGKYSWTMDGAEQAFTQRLTREQLGALYSVCVMGDATLDISSASTSSAAETLTVSNISGNGTLALSLGSNYSNKLVIGDAFTGTTYVKSGNFTINGSTFGNTLKLADGVNFQLSGGSTVVLNKNLVLDGTTQIHQNTKNNVGATLTINGTVSGANGVYVRKGGGTLNLNGSVELGGYTQDVSGAVTNFNADSGIGRLSLSNGTLNIGENATITIRDSLSVTGGVFNINNNARLNIGNGATASVNALNIGTGGSVRIGDDATLNINAVQSADTVDFLRISGTGTLGVKLGTGYGQKLAISSDFTGTTHVMSGTFTLNDSTFGNVLKLGDGVNFQLTHDSTVVMTQDLVLDGTSQIHQNTASKGATLTITGAVSGSNGIYQRKGGGTLTFEGTVNLKSFEQNTNATTIFNNKTTLGSMNITKGVVKVNNALTLNGGNRLEISAGGKLQLGDGAFVNRTNGVACWVQGNLEVLQNADARFVSVDDVHVSYSNGSNMGIISLAADSSLEMDVKGLYFYTGNSVQLGSGAELSLTRSNVVLSNQGSSMATLVASSVQATAGQQYSTSNDKFELSNGHISSVSSQDVTLANKLTNSSVENAGGGKLTVTNAANTLTGVVAGGGDVSLLNMAESMSLNMLEVAENHAVGAYVGVNESASRSAVTVKSSASFGANASLVLACLTLDNGVRLEMTDTSAAVNLNGAALTLGNGLQMGEKLLADVLALGCGESLALFTGVSEFNVAVGVSDYASDAGQMLASTYFSNLVGYDNLYITYTMIGEEGSLLVMHAIPESTTATLSLLALAGLALRRRRR